MHSDRIDPAFGHWLAGFVDGEGCFYIGRICNRKKGVEYVNYRCAFTLSLRDDDLPILEEIRDLLGGRIVTRAPRHVGTFQSTAPCAALEIGTKEGTQALVRFFDRFPLRAKKARDYAIWREGVQEWATKGRGVGRNDWSRMAQLHQDLKNVRKYA